MATFIHRFVPALLLAALSAPAHAGDVSVKLDSGAGFVVKNSTGAIERLRVDEATGNISRNGALFVQTTAANSLFVGPGAGNPAGPSQWNTGFGVSALQTATIGYFNSAFGTFALRSDTSGYFNSAFGYAALAANTVGNGNTALGEAALTYNTDGNWNTAVGASAMVSNTTGTGNTSVGSSSLLSNSTGSSNSAVGGAALSNNTTGFSNTAMGYNVLAVSSTAHHNSAFGKLAMFRTTTGSNNAAFGSGALYFNTTGIGNTALGQQALYLSTTGSRNVALGASSGYNQTSGNDNIYLANPGVAAESGKIKIGTSGTHNATFVAGIRGVTTANANAIPVLIDSAGQLGTVSSSRSVKKDIRDMGDATDRLLELRPVTFHYKQEQTLPGGSAVPPEYGLIAEEVAEVFPDLVVYDDQGKPFTVKYHELSPMLLNEVKKQQQVIAAQNARIERLERALAVRKR